MKSLKTLATEFWQTHPGAKWDDAKRHAQSICGNDDDVVEFCKHWQQLKIDQAGLIDDVNRIWPEEKGY